MTALWSALQLHHSPFENSAHYQPTFYPPSAHQTLGLLEKSLRKKELTLLIGEAGCGKSMLLKRFYKQSIRQGVFLQATSHTHITNLIKAMALAAHTTPPSLQLSSDRQLFEIQQSITQHTDRFIIVIDHAHTLPIPTLAALVHLLAHQNKKVFSVVLAGQSKLQKLVNGLTMKGSQGIQVGEVEMEAWQKKDIKTYAASCMKQAGWHSELPKLKRSFWEQITQHSQGLPGEVNDLLHKRLLAEILALPEVVSQQAVEPPSWLLGASLVMILVFWLSPLSQYYIQMSDHIVMYLVNHLFAAQGAI